MRHARPGSSASTKAHLGTRQKNADLDLLPVAQEVRWIASMILEQAVKDLEHHYLHIRLYAHDFIMSDDFEYWADFIDVDTQAAREALRTRLDDAVKELNDVRHGVGPDGGGAEEADGGPGGSKSAC